jgi:type IV pilus assembly protein PilP
MIEKNIDNTEIPAKLMDTLRRGYGNDREKTVKDCPMSENAIAYALEELAPDARQKVADHLQSCGACMNLVLDARSAETESQAPGGRHATVLPALSDAIKRPAKPCLIEKLAAGLRMPSMTPKIIATAAVACMAAPIAYYILKDPAAVRKLPVVTNQIAPAQIKKKQQTHPPAKNLQEEPASLHSVTTREGWSIDPFEPIYGEKSRAGALLKKRAKGVSRPRTPLEAIELSQVKLVGIMLSDNGNTALVEDATGKGYVIKEGTYIGRSAGRVIEILKDRFIVEEEIEDVHGNIISRKRIIKLNKP